MDARLEHVIGRHAFNESNPVACLQFLSVFKVRAVPLRSISALTVAKVFMRDCIFAYRPPERLLSDNGKQFTAKLFQRVCRSLRMTHMFTTTYHIQTNVQVQRLNRKLLTSLREFVKDHPQRWNEFTPALAFAYNTQVHRGTDFYTLYLVLARPPGPTTIKIEPSTTMKKHPGHVRMEFLSQMRRLFHRVRETLAKAQARYKCEFDERVRPLDQAQVGDEVYLERQGYMATADPRERKLHKLLTNADGPYPLIERMSTQSLYSAME